jgi:hypothetical protein
MPAIVFVNMARVATAGMKKIQTLFDNEEFDRVEGAGEGRVHAVIRERF